jgi:hypothetical protein
METKAMKIYKVLPDYGNFSAFRLPMKDLILKLGKKIPPKKLMHFYKHNLSLQEQWENISATFEPVEGITEGQNQPDISTWVSGTLVMSGRSKSVLTNLEELGEILPVETNQGAYWIFNCSTIVAPDESRSSRVVESGQVLDIQTLIFNTESLDDKQLFKTDYDGFRSLFCTDKFRAQVIDNNLGGILFSEELAGAFE